MEDLEDMEDLEGLKTEDLEDMDDLEDMEDLEELKSEELEDFGGNRKNWKNWKEWCYIYHFIAEVYKPTGQGNQATQAFNTKLYPKIENYIVTLFYDPFQFPTINLKAQ